MVIGGVGGMVIGLSVAEKLGRPFVQTHLQPVGAASTAYPGLLMPWVPRWLGPQAWRLSHHISEAVVWAPFKGAMAKVREQVLGLKGRPTASDGQAVLYGFSQHVLPATVDPKRPNHVTGYWFLPHAADWVPPPALVAFLERPGPVVSVGFGSMTSNDPRALAGLVLAAARDAGVRVVLLSGWGGLVSDADNDICFCIDAVPHDWLFARVAAVVHHGGAGTTGAAFKAGVPAIVVPFTMDQPFWGHRVAQLGTGPKPIARRQLARHKLAAALHQALNDQGMRERAAQLGQLIRAEQGVHNAVELLGRV